MRGKKAKELRKENKNKITRIITIQVFEDGRVEVLGFPSNYHAAMSIMQAGIRRMGAYFIEEARKDKVDDKLNLIQSKIIQPDKNLVIPGRM